MCLFRLVCVCVFSCMCCVLCARILPEGSPCWSEDNKNGTCVNLYRCNSAAIAYLFRKVGLQWSAPEMPPTCSVRPDGEPVVCCIDCKLDHAEGLRDNAVMPLGSFYKKSGPKSWLKTTRTLLILKSKEIAMLIYNRVFACTLPYPCRGASQSSLLPYWDEQKQCQELQYITSEPGIGGEDAKKDQYPHMALLGYGADRRTAQWLCGGTVISERFILTAGHCISTPTLGPITYAGLGILERRDLNDYWKVYKIISIIKHPEYRPPSKYHDIALIKTENEINFGRSILPACLHIPSNFSVEFGEAPGWGRLGHRGNIAEHLQAMFLNRYNESDCSSMFPPHRHLRQGYNHTTQMCFGRRDQIVDTCEGDSGGPLHSVRWHCMYLVMGVTSFGRDCGIPGYPGMYTRVSYYLPWIESVVWPEQ